MANTDKELISDAITSSGTFQRDTGKYESGAVTSTASVIHAVGKKVSGNATASATVRKDAGKKLSGNSTTTANIKRDVDKNLSKTATTSGTIKKSTSKKISKTVTITATKAVNNCVPLIGSHEPVATSSDFELQALDQLAFQISAFEAKTNPKRINPSIDEILMTVRTVCKILPFFTPRLLI